MALTLRDGLSFCIANGRAVFLDLQLGRYFCLPAASDAAFRRLVDRRQFSEASSSEINGLVHLNILQWSPDPHSVVTPTCHYIPIGFLDETITPPGTLMRLIEATTYHILAGFSLKSRPILHSIETVKKKKSRIITKSSKDVHDDVFCIGISYIQASRIISPNEKCLQRSLAIIHNLLDRHCSADLVFGVRMSPFLAHCWVQTSTHVISDHPDHVRTFTPILVV